MRAALFAFSRGGCVTARRVMAALPEEAWMCYTMPRFEEPGFLALDKAVYGACFSAMDALIFVGACGIAVREIRSYSAAVAGMPSKDTVKLVDADGFASVTPERAHVWMIQTPQGFTYPLIRAAYDKMMSREEYQQGVTDDAMVVETMTDHKVRLTEGSYRNIKVTTPEDMEVAAAFLQNKKS